MPEALPIACSLEPGELTGRRAQMAQLGADALVGLTIAGARATLRFRSGEGIESAVDEFVAAESACCPFFDFATRREADETVLSVTVPADGEWGLRGLVAAFAVGWSVPT